MRKINSTNAVNERRLNGDCDMAYTLSLIGSRWKPTILWRLIEGKMRYHELRKSITGISERVLVLQLRELENAQLIHRIVYPEVPPRVEYELTELGRSMQPLLEHLSDWGLYHRESVAAQNDVAVPSNNV
ncbi:winged helix-turn-helix transcriptional regulator [Chitinophaga vietnamensis]|uniref:winged helix-turn-helix transcriptional regulator n=1 Tax=Chitinophaga vietnamensis TaxID=2593957 RepID=UPI0011775010|nr:helix-turn-helix domain-containing protein [Chitinophaga vietnamensis]